MRQDIEVHEILRSHICTLKKASLEYNTRVYMSESKMKVINFDKIPAEYCKKLNLADMPKSNDALYITPDKTWYMIEFKNGTIDKAEVYRKLYDSIIMLIELKVIPDFQFAREHIVFILVYNSEKFTRAQKSESRNRIYGRLRSCARTEQKLFEINKFEKYLCKETHTYSKEEFESKFTVPMEELESLA